MSLRAIVSTATFGHIEALQEGVRPQYNGTVVFSIGLLSRALPVDCVVHAFTLYDHFNEI